MTLERLKEIEEREHEKYRLPFTEVEGDSEFERAVKLGMNIGRYGLALELLLEEETNEYQ